MKCLNRDFEKEFLRGNNVSLLWLGDCMTIDHYFICTVSGKCWFLWVVYSLVCFVRDAIFPFQALQLLIDNFKVHV